jgi:glycosyltransferase involved in cell wall biosynthesis
MEAMAAGLPVVATSTGGVPEIVGDAGILVPVRDSAAMAAALRELVEDAGRRAELSRRAQERSESFDAAAMVQAYSELFERTVGR